MSPDTIATWAQRNIVDPLEIDCVITLMLKILDGKCKMNEADKAAAIQLYDAVGQRPCLRLTASDCHALIAEARQENDEALKMRIYEQRLLAETMLSRPVMKAFKARLRAAGILRRSDTGPEANDEAA